MPSVWWSLQPSAHVLAGILAVVRSNKEQDRPYTGLTEIRSGEVAEDLAGYLADSEQASSALALGVSIHRDAAVRAAGGYFIQVGGASLGAVSTNEHQKPLKGCAGCGSACLRELRQQESTRCTFAVAPV